MSGTSHPERGAISQYGRNISFAAGNASKLVYDYFFLIPGSKLNYSYKVIYGDAAASP
jgi:hypothetical protein